VSINALPDEVLLEIFTFTRVAALAPPLQPWPDLWLGTWRALVHVCRRWRNVMFSSPLRLNLRIYCTEKPYVRETLDVWPSFLPIDAVSYNLGDSMVAALEHRDRICELCIRITWPQYENLKTTMQEPFPSMTSLKFWYDFREPPLDDGSLPVLPVAFLGGSAPRLRSLTLMGVPFPTLPQFLLSCNDLSELSLHDITDPGYISPEAMVTGLSALTRLKELYIEFDESVVSRSNRMTRCLPPVTRAILPALMIFDFKGTDEYLEDFLARIDAPQLKTFEISFFYQDTYDIRQVVHHSRTFGSFNRAEMIFTSNSISIKLCQPEGTDPIKTFELFISDEAEESSWQVSSLAQICSQFLSLLSGVTEMEILSDPYGSGEDDFPVLDDPIEWLELLRPFTDVQTLFISGDSQSDVVSSLQVLTMESVMEMLPALQNLYCSYDPRDDYEEELIELFFFLPEPEA
jgi:hypothetical protein